MRVYVAGPYTKGDVALNVRAAIEAGDRLLKAGHAPYIPHLTHFWHLVCPGPYEQWTLFDLAYLGVCDAVVRIPGESRGADAEVMYAVGRHIPIFMGLDDFLREVGPGNGAWAL
jgi:hypothetical protein